MFHKGDLGKNEFMLTGGFAKRGYDWWWHSFTGINEETGEEKAFFIEFFLCNPLLLEDEPVLGQLLENKKQGKKPSYLMVKAGCWGEDHVQLHRFFSWKQVQLREKAPFFVAAQDCFVTETATYGKISISEQEAKEHPEWMCDAGEMAWELNIDKKIAYNVGYGTSNLFRKLEAFEMYWHAEGMKTLYSGNVTLNGKKYAIIPEKSYGYADKNWGRNFTSPWIWLSSNNMVSKLTHKKLSNSVFDIGGGRPRVFGIPFKNKLLGAFYYEGEEFEYNFSKFYNPSRTKFVCRETDDEIQWLVIQCNRKSMMKTRVRCKKKDMLLVNYESPDGMKRYNRLWNGGNGIGNIKLYERQGNGWIMIDDIAVRNIGCEYGEFDQ